MLQRQRDYYIATDIYISLARCKLFLDLTDISRGKELKPYYLKQLASTSHESRP